MSEIDFRKLCKLFSEKLSATFIERIERRLGQDFKEAVEKNPKELLMDILQDIHMYYVNPYEMSIELSEYLQEVYGISKFSLSFSESFDFPLSEKIEEASKFVATFYKMIDSLGLNETFSKQNKKWWKDEFQLPGKR